MEDITSKTLPTQARDFYIFICSEEWIYHKENMVYQSLSLSGKRIKSPRNVASPPQWRAGVVYIAKELRSHTTILT